VRGDRGGGKTLRWSVLSTERPERERGADDLNQRPSGYEPDIETRPRSGQNSPVDCFERRYPEAMPLERRPGAGKNVRWTFLRRESPELQRREDGLRRRIDFWDLVAGAGFEPTTFRL
jgi:hypothetical protein